MKVIDRMKVIDMKAMQNDCQNEHLPEETLRVLAGGSLGYEERLRALEHLEACPTCAKAFADLISRRTLLRPAPDFSVRLIKSPEQRKKELRRYTARVSAAACAALMLIASQMWMTLSSDGDFLAEMGTAGIPGIRKITEITEKGSAASVEQVEKIMDSVRGISNRMINWGGENSNVTKEK